MNTDKTDKRERNFRRVAVLVIGMIAVHFSWLIFHLGGDKVVQYFSDLATVSMAILSGVVCAFVAVHSNGRARRSWAILGASALCWAFGSITWNIYELVLHKDVPTPSLADVGYLGFFPLAGWGAFSFASGPTGPHARIRAILDGLTIGLVLLFLGWLFTLGPIQQSQGSLVVDLINAAYPVGDIVLATIGLSVFFTFRSTPKLSRHTVTLLGLSLLAFLVSDVLYSVLSSLGTYKTGSLTDEGWFSGFCFLLLAALWPHPYAGERVSATVSATRWGQILPTATAPFALTVAFIRMYQHHHLDVVAAALALTLTVVVLLRQIMTVTQEQNITHLLEARVADHTAEIGHRKQHFNALMQHSSDITIVVLADGYLSYVSPSVERLLGHVVGDLAEGNIADIVKPSDRSRVLGLLAMAARQPGTTVTAEWHMVRPDGQEREVEALMRNLLDEPAVGGIVLNLRDVTERRELRDRLNHQALHDDLTGLANRAYLRQRIEQALSRWLFHNEPCCLLIVDLDDFKTINDSFGHVAGDAALKVVARRIERCTRRGDTVVRLNSDEFAILLEGVSADDDEAKVVADRIISAVGEPMRVEGRVLNLRASLGMACVADNVAYSEDILRNADLALHSAKQMKRGGFVQFHKTMYEDTLRRAEMETDLRRALDGDELQIYYQPTMDMATGRMEGMEALLRWPHAEKGFIPPMDFIPIAEESGLIVPVGTWVLRHACTQMAKWQARYPSDQPLTLNVNLSSRQLDQPDFVEIVRAALDDTGLAPGTLVLEMTESVLIENKPTTLAKMQALVNIGVGLAIDDFGTGYSSLSYLRQFPIDVLKIDRSFVKGMSGIGDNEESALVQAIIDLARTLKLKTIAEGVETRLQLEVLQRMGCDVGQGFFLARPAPAEDVRRLVAATHAGRLPITTTTE